MKTRPGTEGMQRLVSIVFIGFIGFRWNGVTGLKGRGALPKEVHEDVRP